MPLLSGPHVPLLWDFPVDSNNSVQTPNLPTGVLPVKGDPYQFQVTFSDLSTLTMPATVTDVLALAQSLQMNSPVNSSSGTPDTIPVLNWVAPSPAPTITPYTYNVNLQDSTNQSSGVSWSYSGGQNGNGIPSTTTNVPFDVDGSASNTSSCGSGPSSPCLASGTTYDWWVTVQDANGNSSQITTPYTTTGTPFPTAPPYFFSSSI